MAEKPLRIAVVLGEVAADFPLQAWQHQTLERVVHHRQQQLPVRVPVQRQVAQCDLADASHVRVQPDAHDLFLLAAIDGQHPVRRHLTDEFLEVEVVAVFLALALGHRLDLLRHQLGRIPQEVADWPTNTDGFRDDLREDVLHAVEHIVHVVKLFPAIDHSGQNFVELVDCGVPVPDCESERFEAAFLRFRGERALLRLVGQVQVFEALGALCRENGSDELVVELALEGDALEDRVLPFRERAKLTDAILNAADHIFVEAAGTFLPVACDERDGILLVEQLQHGFDLVLANLQVLGDP